MLNSLDIYTLSNIDSFNVVVKDNLYEDISMQIAAEVNNLRSVDATEDAGKKIFQAAGFGKGDNNQVNVTYRSDLRCWVTPDLCREYKLPNMEQLVKRLIKICAPLKESHKLNGDYSVQLTVYPGNGAHYVRHLDTFSSPPVTSYGGNKGSHRRLTLLFYLNTTHDGGQLRVYRNNTDASDYIDIDPIMNRLVIFRSDTVEHEVLPSYSDRIAISLWASSSLPPQINTSAVLLKSLVSTSSVSAAVSIATPSASNLPSLLLPSKLSRSIEQRAQSCRIFVSMVNYRDSEGPHTIRDLYAKATHPKRIFMGVVFQGDVNIDSDCVFTGFDNIYMDLNGNVRNIVLGHKEARGPCLARHLATSLWQGEEYFLQIDSHMRFRQNWDSYLISVLEHIKEQYGSNGDGGAYCKPILTTYPLGYTLPNNVPDDIRPTVLVPIRFDNDCMLRQSAKIIQPIPQDNCRIQLPLFVKSPLWASGFSFSDSSLIHEVPYNPYLNYLFFGEELSMAARLFTSGYDFFAPTEAVIYHLYSRAHRPTFQEVQSTTREKLKSVSQSSVRKMLGISHPSPSCGAHCNSDVLDRFVEKSFGLGNVRSLTEFEKTAGISLRNQTVDVTKNWNEFINDCANLHNGSEDNKVTYHFITNKSGDSKTIEELCSSSVSTSRPDTSIENQLQVLAGLDRVKQFLGK